LGGELPVSKHKQLTLADAEPDTPIIDTSAVDTSSEKYLSVYQYVRWSMLSMANGEERVANSGTRYTPRSFVIDLTDRDAAYDLRAFEDLVAEGLAVRYPKIEDATHTAFRPPQIPDRPKPKDKVSRDLEEQYLREYYYTAAESFFKNPVCKFRLKIDYANPGGLSQHRYFQDAIRDMEAKGRIFEEVRGSTWTQYIATENF
jgi:hypothetical protein